MNQTADYAEPCVSFGFVIKLTLGLEFVVLWRG